MVFKKNLAMVSFMVSFMNQHLENVKWERYYNQMRVFSKGSRIANVGRTLEERCIDQTMQPKMLYLR